MQTARLYLGDPLPEIGPETGLVIMGGPMNVEDDDKFSWLPAERAFIAKHIADGGHVFGVCLGGQLIARSLGAAVTRNPQKEIGWWPVHFHQDARQSGLFEGFPETLTALQWHGDTFAIPEGAYHVASSDVCPSQAFTIGDRVVGLQFHFEAEAQEVHDFVRFFDSELQAGGTYVQQGEQILAGLKPYAEPCQQALYKLLDRWAG